MQIKQFRLSLLLGTILLTLIPAFAQNPELLSHFQYDKSAPLDIKMIEIQKRVGVTIYDITYASPKGGVVPAYLVLPDGKGPFAAVVWGHWYWKNSPMRNRKEFLDEALALADAGVVSLLPDGPVARPGHVAEDTPLSEKAASDLLQAILDMRRGIDLLFARADVDQKRLAYVGHSYHAAIGAFLSGIDKRPKAYVLMAGALSDEIDSKTKEYQTYRDKLGPEKFDAFMSKYSWLDPGRYIRDASPAFIMMQFANREKFLTPDHVRQYEAIVSKPNVMKFYDAPHALNAEARRDRIEFLTKQLKLKKLDSSDLETIPDLYQPPDPE